MRKSTMTPIDKISHKRGDDQDSDLLPYKKYKEGDLNREFEIAF